MANEANPARNNLNFYKSPSGGFVNVAFSDPSLKGSKIYTAEEAGVNAPSPKPNQVTTTPVINQPVTTPTSGTPATTPTKGGTSSPMYSSAKPFATDSAYAQASQNILPADAPTQEQFYSKIWGMLQPAIDAINKTEYSAEMGAGIASTKRTSAQNLALNARGLAGSSEAGAMAYENEQEYQQAVAQAKADQASKIADLTKFAIPESYKQYQDALTRNDALSANYISTQKQKAQNAMKGVAESGMGFDDFQKEQPDAYNNLLQYYDGDVNQMKADFIANVPTPNIGEPIKAGTNLIYTYIDPITKQVKTTSIDTGTNLTDDTKITKSADGGLVLYNSRTGEFKELGGGNPYYLQNQALLAQGRAAMIKARYGSVIKGITTQLFPTPSSNPMNLYANSLNYTTKLNEAYKMSNDPQNKEKGPSDLELADSAIKINNGGQQITETQFNSFNNSLGSLGVAKLSWDKFQLAASGGGSLLLTKGQRDAIYKLANQNVVAQRNNAINATKVIQGIASRSEVPSELLKTPEDIISLSAGSGVGEMDNLNQPQPDDIQSQLNNLSPEQLQELQSEGLTE